MSEMEVLGYILVGGFIFIFINLIFDISSFFINLKYDYKDYVYFLCDKLGNVKYITNNSKKLLKFIKDVSNDYYIEVIKDNELYKKINGDNLYEQFKKNISPLYRLKSGLNNKFSLK